MTGPREPSPAPDVAKPDRSTPDRRERKDPETSVRHAHGLPLSADDAPPDAAGPDLLAAAERILTDWHPWFDPLKSEGLPALAEDIEALRAAVEAERARRASGGVDRA